MTALLDPDEEYSYFYMPPLTRRELIILRLLAGDLSFRGIGSELFISYNTVRTHIASIYRKLGVNNRHDAVKRGRTKGFIDPEFMNGYYPGLMMKCDDERCPCCHAENMHKCLGPPASGVTGDTYTCPECDAVWTCRIGRPHYWPQTLTWRHEGPWWEADRPIPSVPELERRRRE